MQKYAFLAYFATFFHNCMLILLRCASLCIKFIHFCKLASSRSPRYCMMVILRLAMLPVFCRLYFPPIAIFFLLSYMVWCVYWAISYALILEIFCRGIHHFSRQEPAKQRIEVGSSRPLGYHGQYGVGSRYRPQDDGRVQHVQIVGKPRCIPVARLDYQDIARHRNRQCLRLLCNR